MSHAALRKRSEADHARKLASFEKYDRAADRKMIQRAVAQHESNDHKGQPKTKLKLATGGAAMDGDLAKPRLDRPGKSPPKKSAGKGAHVNVIVANAPKEKEPVPVPVPAMGAPKPSMAPPPGPMPGAGPPIMPPRPPGPPIAAGAPPIMPRRNGGRAGFAKGGVVNMDAGSKSGPGRLEKIALQKRDDATDKKKERAEGGEFKRGGKAAGPPGGLDKGTSGLKRGGTAC